MGGNLLHRFAARGGLVQGFLIPKTRRLKKMNYDWSFFLVIAVAIVAVMLLDLVRKDWRGWPRYVLAFLCAVVLNIAVTVLLVMFRLGGTSPAKGR